jgi:hypothetical protein
VVIKDRLARSDHSEGDDGRERRRKSSKLTEPFRERFRMVDRQRMGREMRSNGMVGLTRALAFLAFWLVQVPPAAGHKSGLL